MKSIIIGTAGHIDHGKTALVKALTGIDADRLAEEKRRGITIDLGFAHMELPLANGEILRIGFVDVPGHERFVRNMLAGAGGIDLVLLVIAADEAIKPQTREHFDILQLLGVQHGITVLTKSDAVDAGTLGVVRMEVEEFLRGTFLESAKSPIVAVSALTGAGLEELKQAIIRVAEQAPTRDAQAIPRLPIDRVFTMKGFGTVVTGTLIAGTIRREDELEVFPGGLPVRVRGVQVHGQAAEIATAGQRTAVNLSGTSTADLARGMTLVPPGVLSTTRQADVMLRLLPSAPVLKDRARVHFHSNAMEAVAEVVLHRSPELNPEIAAGKIAQMRPGTQAFVRIKLPEPALLLPGDRFIVRRFSPVETIGGGVVLDASPLGGFKDPSLSRLLNAALPEDAGVVLAERIARNGMSGMSLAKAVAETGCRAEVVQSRLRDLVGRGVVFQFGGLLLDAAVVARLQALIPQATAEFHQQNQLVAGIAKQTLREQLDLAPEVFMAIVEWLVLEKKLEVVNDLVCIPGHGVVLKDEEAQSKKKIEDAFASAGLKVPALPDVLAGLKIDRPRAHKIVTLLLRDKVLIKVSEELVFHRSALQGLRAQLAKLKTISPKIDVAKFKDITGVSRKYAIPLLEYLDRERVTKRVGDTREIL